MTFESKKKQKILGKISYNYVQSQSVTLKFNQWKHMNKTSWKGALLFLAKYIYI